MTADRALESMNHAGAAPWFQSAAVSKDAKAVIVRLTPDQALRLCDLIAEDED